MTLLILLLLAGILVAILTLAVENDATRRDVAALKAHTVSPPPVAVRIDDVVGLPAHLGGLDDSLSRTVSIVNTISDHVLSDESHSRTAPLDTPDDPAEAVTEKIHRPAPGATAGETFDATYSERLRLMNQDPDEYFRQYPRPHFN